jgi:hypothetical protein
MKQFLAAAGLILEFVSFWLVTPHLLGSDRLRRLVVLASGGAARVLETTVYLVAAQAAFAAVVLLLVFVPYQMGYLPYGGLGEEVLGWAAVIIGSTLAGIIGIWASTSFRTKYIRPILATAADNDRLRSVLGRLGLILFVCGFLLQLGATLAQ